MAHELEIRDGQAKMFYVGETPWHRLGIACSGAPTCEEVVQMIGADYTVVKQPMYIQDSDPCEYAVPNEPTGYYMLARFMPGHGMQQFGVVSGKYRILQNRKAFQFFDPLVQTGQVEYHTGGFLYGGKRLWVLCKVNGGFSVKGDEVQKYVLLTNSHDGKASVQIRFTPIRVVCNNTLTMALGYGADAQQMVNIAHDGEMHGKMDRLQDLLGLVLNGFKDIEETFNAFADHWMNDTKIEAYVRSVLPLQGASEQWDRTKIEREAVTRMIYEGKGNDQVGIRGTLWAAYNGVTEYADHCRMPRSAKRDESRLNKMWFGEGAQLKQRAFAEAVALVHAKGN